MWQWWKKIIGYGKEETAEDPMKYLIAGLGNIGSEYEGTRHNVGFDVVDGLAEAAGATWSQDKLAARTEIKHRGRRLVLIKPSTYMNRSGKAVRYWMEKLSIPAERVMVIVDDIHIDFGKLRMRGKGSDGGHNGLRDIQQQLGSSKYPRLKVGIGSGFHKGQQVDYVLGKWSAEQKRSLPEIIKKAGEAVKSFTAIGLGHTMNQYNS